MKLQQYKMQYNAKNINMSTIIEREREREIQTW
jgi:hypothetical protein